MVKITVIIPAYNVESYIEECLDSVVNQSFGDIEIVCVNDGSTDNTLDILNVYAEKDSRIRIINQTNHGLSYSRNIAMENARGEYICFLDADDYLDLDTLEKTYAISEEKSLDFVIFKLIDFDDETRELKADYYFDMPYLKRIVGDSVFSIDEVQENLYKMCVTAPGKLYRHDFIKDFKFPEGLIFEDNAYFTELMFNAKRIYFLDEYLYFRRVRFSSITNSNANFSDWIDIANLLADITKKYGYYDNARYKRVVFCKKIYNSYKHFLLARPEDKEDFFKKLQEDFKNHQQEYEASEIFYNLDPKAKLIFRTGIEAKNHEEFELTIRIYELERSNKKLEKQNSKLKRNIKSYKRKNDVILNSTSWKTTKPLRMAGNIFK